MQVRELAIPGVLEIIPKKFGDARGFFSETWSRQAFEKAGLAIDWIQDNQSFSAEKGVLRGLHFQRPPFAQDKLVRVIRGAIFDVAIDIRHGSPSFGQWVGLHVSADAWNQILVPKGFAHGFLTLEPATEVIYKVSEKYAPEHDRSIRFDDPTIGIAWPLDGATSILSDKDRKAPFLSGLDTGFVY